MIGVLKVYCNFLSDSKKYMINSLIDILLPYVELGHGFVSSFSEIKNIYIYFKRKRKFYALLY